MAGLLWLYSSQIEVKKGQYQASNWLMTKVQPRENLPSTVGWLPHSQSAIFLQIHESQYRRDVKLLDTLGLVKRDKYAKGCDRKTLEVLQEFRQLVEQRGRISAARELIRRYQQNE